jgi:hypothetical protein
VLPEKIVKMPYICHICGVAFAKNETRVRHMNRVHAQAAPVFDCIICGAIFQSIHLMHQHILTHAPNPEFVRVQHLYSGSCTIYRKSYLPPTASLDLTLGQDHDDLVRLLAAEVAVKRFAKCSIVLAAEFLKMQGTDVMDSIIVHLRASSFTLTVYQNFIRYVESAHAEIANNLSDFLERGSGWVLNAIYAVEVQVARCRPLSGACGPTTLNLDKRRERGALHPAQALAGQLDPLGDKKCFYYAIAQYFIALKSDELTRAFVEQELITTGISLPVAVHQIPKFEELNAHLNLKINVIYREDVEGNYIYPVYASRRTDCSNHITLLLYKAVVNDVVVPHYVFVPNVAKLLRKTYRGEKGDIGYERTSVCPNCLNKFSSDRVRDKHFELCSKNKVQAVVMPVREDRIEFKNFCKRFKVPVVAFYDFEAVMVSPKAPCSVCQDMSLCYHKTLVQSIQQAGTYSLLVVDYLGQVIHQSTYSGDNCAEAFINELLDIEPSLQRLLEAAEPLFLTPADERNFQAADICHICERPFNENNVKVRDHDHLEGSFLGAAHQLCNLKRVVVRKVTIFCHNFQSYDSHFIW